MREVTGKTKSYLAGGIRTNVRDVEERNGLEIRDRNCDNILDRSTETLSLTCLFWVKLRVLPAQGLVTQHRELDRVI